MDERESKPTEIGSFTIRGMNCKYGGLLAERYSVPHSLCNAFTTNLFGVNTPSEENPANYSRVA
jgi:hypothetical protein